MSLMKIENKLDCLKIPNSLLLIIILVTGFLVRVYFTYWDINLESSDAFLFLLEAISFSEGNFEEFSIRSLWPILVSPFLSIFQFEELIDSMNVMRMISISISSITILVIFKISREFVKVRYALFVAALFAFDPSLIQNSVFGIREPIFILLGLISFFYVIQKNEKFMLLAFLFAGLALDVRLNAIVLPIFLCITIFFRFKSLKKISIYILVGIGIFLIASIPYILIPIDQGQIPFIHYATDASNIISENKISPSTYTESNNDDQEIITVSIVREIIHFGRISLPLTWIFAFIGFFSWINYRDFKFYAVISLLIIILVIALPMYFQSAEYRNLLLASPLLFILAGVGLERKLERIKFKKIILFSLTIILFLSSIVFINLLDNRDRDEILEKENVGKIIVQKFSGRFLGDLFDNISQNIPNVKHGGVEGTSNSLYYNENISITIQNTPITSSEFLMSESKRLKVDYLIIDNKLDNRFPLFEDIFENENKYPYLEKRFEYISEKIDLHVKVFKINYEF